VLAGIVHGFALRSVAADRHLAVLSADPGATRAEYGVQSVARTDMASVRRLLAESDLFISGGGSLLQDVTSLRSLAYYLGIIRLALAARTPVMLYAQGIGPLRRRLARTLTRVIANRVAYITVRDRESAETLRRIGVCRPPVEVTADPAFALPVTTCSRERLTAAGLPTDRPLVGLGLRPWREGAPGTADLARLVGRIHSVSGLEALLIPMQAPGDALLARRIAEAVPGGVAHVPSAPLGTADTLEVIGALRALAAMRLHALIFGAMQGVPIVSLSYDPKVTSLMEDLGQTERNTDVGQFDPDTVAERLVEALRAADTIRTSLRASADEMRKRALVNVDRALSMAGRR
jgi:polysaccharide pyruvyl transferase CsaB